MSFLFTETFAYGSATLTGQTTGGFTWADSVNNQPGTSFTTSSNTLLSKSSATHDCNMIPLTGVNWNKPWTITFTLTLNRLDGSTTGRGGEMQVGDITLDATGVYFYLEWDATSGQAGKYNFGIGGFWDPDPDAPGGANHSAQYASATNSATAITNNAGHAMEWSHDGHGNHTLKIDGVTVATTTGTPGNPQFISSQLEIGSYRDPGATTQTYTIDDLIVRQEIMVGILQEGAGTAETPAVGILRWD